MVTNLDESHDEMANGEARQFLTFRVDGEEYGVDIMQVREIKGWTDTTRLPNSPEYLRGVMNLRGVIVPIFDLRTRFHKGVTEATITHVNIILVVENRNLGILVDAVSDILTVDVKDIKEAPDVETRADGHFINGLISLEERMVVLLDIHQLFKNDDVPTALAETAA